MSSKKFVTIFSIILSIFTLTNFIVWHFYTEKILTRNGDYITGDLSRLGYISHLIHPRLNVIDLHKQHDQVLNPTTSYPFITIGDSFSLGHSGGKNRFYQDYIASIFNMAVLNVRPYSKTANYIETIVALANSGFLKKHNVQYVLIESTQRHVSERFNKTIDFSLTLPLEQLESFYTHTKEHRFDLPLVSPINNGNLKFLLYSLLYPFSDKALFSDVYKTQLSQSLFSVNGGKELLYYYKDIASIKKNTHEALSYANEQLNQLASLLKMHNITLIVMPAVNKSDLSSPYIIKNKSPKDPFWDILRFMDHQYILLDTKSILENALQKGEKDLFYIDDTHWSYKASEIIINHLKTYF